MIEITNLTKRYRSKNGEVVTALADVNLTIGEQEFLTILGPSGCGKTTLLRAIAGLTAWDSGDIRIDGIPVTGPGPERSMVFQNFALMPWATVVTNIAFGLELRGTSRSEREEVAHDLIDLVGLRGFENKRPGELSGGMQQRVGLARALAVEPRVLLMDEPFGALDEQTRRLLQEELLAIWEQRKVTVVFITHSIDEAVLLGDRVALMSPRPGRIEQVEPVPLERPRSKRGDEPVRTAELVRMTDKLWNDLREMQPDLRPRAAGAGKASA